MKLTNTPRKTESQTVGKISTYFVASDFPPKHEKGNDKITNQT